MTGKSNRLLKISIKTFIFVIAAACSSQKEISAVRITIKPAEKKEVTLRIPGYATARIIFPEGTVEKDTVLNVELNDTKITVPGFKVYPVSLSISPHMYSPLGFIKPFSVTLNINGSEAPSSVTGVLGIVLESSNIVVPFAYFPGEREGTTISWSSHVPGRYYPVEKAFSGNIRCVAGVTQKEDYKWSVKDTSGATQMTLESLPFAAPVTGIFCGAPPTSEPFSTTYQLLYYLSPLIPYANVMYVGFQNALTYRFTAGITAAGLEDTSLLLQELLNASPTIFPVYHTTGENFCSSITSSSVQVIFVRFYHTNGIVQMPVIVHRDFETCSQLPGYSRLIEKANALYQAVQTSPAWTTTSPGYLKCTDASACSVKDNLCIAGETNGPTFVPVSCPDCTCTCIMGSCDWSF